MAREADLIIKGQTDLASARAAMEKFFADFESRELKIKVGSGAGVAGNPATFSNAGGTPWSGTTASDRLDSTSRAISTGASLAMQNGRPGATPGGLFNTAQDRLDATAGPAGGEYPTASAGGVLRAWSAGLPSFPSSKASPADIPTTRLDRLQARLADEQRAAWEYRDTEYAPAYNFQADQTEGQLAIASGMASRPRYGRGASRKMTSALGPMGGAEPASLDDIEALGTALSPEKAAYLQLVGGKSAGSASGMFSQMVGSLSTPAAIFMAGRAIANSASTLSGLPFVGQNPMGSTDSLALRNQLERENMMRSAMGELPGGGLWNGASNYASAAGNWLIGNGFVSREASMTRQAALMDAQPDIERQNLGTFYDRQAGFTFSSGDRIQSRRDRDLSVSEYSIRHDALMTEGGDPNKLNSTGRDKLSAAQYRIESEYQADLLQLGRDNRFGADQDYYAARGASDRGGRMAYAAGIEGVEQQRQAELHALGDPSSDPSVNQSTGYYNRQWSINNKYNQARNSMGQLDQFNADFGRFAAVSGYVSSGLAASGQGLDASLYDASAQAKMERWKIDPSSPTYWQQWATAGQNEENQRNNLTGQFILGNTRAGILGMGGANAQKLATGGYAGAAMQEANNAQYAAAMTGFDWGVDNDPKTGDATRRAAIGRYQGVYSQWQAGHQAATITSTREVMQTLGGARAAMLELGDDPYGARISKINSDEDAAEWKIKNPITLGLMRGQRDLDVRRVNQESNNAAKMIGIGQTYSAESIGRLFRYNSVGAEISGITADAIREGNQITFNGAGGADKARQQAEESRRQSQMRIDLRERQYETGFRGTEFDPIFNNIRNPAQLTDPSEVFAEFEKARKDIAGAVFGTEKGGSDNNPLGGDAAKITGGLTLAGLKTALVQALQALAGSPQ